MRLTMAPLSLALLASSLAAQQVPAAIFTDPSRDPTYPARMVVLHVPSGGVLINGVAYLAAGRGRHPTLVLLHGLPGNEKNLDLAQAVRRAGWNAVAVNYRGSWGSPGSFRIAQTLEDAEAVLAYLRDTAHARTLTIDTTRLVLAGHSLGGWVAAMTASHDHNLRGAILISAANMGGSLGFGAARAKLVAFLRDNMESLANVTAEELADELMTNAGRFDWGHSVPGLVQVPLLVLTADDGLAPEATALCDSLRARGSTQVTLTHIATDHSWSDSRIELETLTLRWLEPLSR